ncbi:hypothetical protein N9L47_10290 [Rhodobacteraceae bacterium]|nr:hypothetical protein [Paracoccaceae bacterium]
MTQISDLMDKGKFKRRPRYTIVLHDVREKLNLSVNTYIVIDSIHKLNLNHPAEIVQWNIKPGEHVLFRFSDLQAFSKDIIFHRRVSLSIGTLVFGRMILYYAEGPGTLLLRTGATAEISTPRNEPKPSEPETFVAWSMPITFYVDAKLDCLNSFISSVNLKVQRPGHFVRDTDEKRVSSSSGILRFITHFLLPL